MNVECPAGPEVRFDFQFLFKPVVVKDWMKTFKQISENIHLIQSFGKTFVTDKTTIPNQHKSITFHNGF